MKSLQAGYARVAITPEKPMPLAGYGATMRRISENILDELQLSCVAISDELGKTVLLISQDLINSHWHMEARRAISEATGLPTEQIIVAGTHTHSAPDQLSQHENILAWKPTYLQQAVAAARAALEDRSAASVSVGQTKTDRLNFVRHYLLSDGSYGGDNFGDFKNNTIVDHAEPNDPNMQVIRFVRKGKQDILMVNWQAHPTLTGGVDKKDMSSDFIGSTREYVEAATGALFIYFTGAAGNHNAKSRIAEEERTRDNKAFGKLLGEYVLDTLQNMKAVAAAAIQTRQCSFEGKINHTMEDKLEQAKEVSELYKATDRATGNALAHTYGFTSVYHANAVVRRSSMGETGILELNALSLGDISFVTIPNEVFAAQGIRMKAESPFETTFVISCCNGSNGYLPTVKAYDYGCYESYTGKFARGTGDQVADTLVSMLKEMKKSGAVL